MKQSPIKTGVIGVGHIGKIHARVYSELERSAFTAVYDSNRDAAEAVARKYNVHAAASLEEFASRVEAATISTPTATHYAICKPLLAAGLSLLVEKPITETVEQAAELVELAKAKPLILQVGHIERFNPALEALEKLLTKPRFIEAHRLSNYPGRGVDIGVILDLMIHDLEVILHLVQSPVVSIDAVGIPVLSPTEDIANARLRFENGCVANVTASRISPEKLRKIRVFQEDTYLSLDYQGQSGEIYRKQGDKITRDKVAIEKQEPLKKELDEFLRCAAEGGEPRVGGPQAAEALELAIRITRMAAEQAAG